jgi:predicted transport protein
VSEIKLFRVNGKTAVEIAGDALALEKSLQTLIETNLETFLGVRLVASEHRTGKSHAGRIDTLGIDENHFPVIVEYKRATNENVISQGLFYLDWLLDNRADFKLLTMDHYGKDEAERIDWTGPRIICIAADYTRYDLHAVQQINRNIDLIRYRRFGGELLALELVHTVATIRAEDEPGGETKPKAKQTDKSVTQTIAELDPAIGDVYEAMRAFLLALGDDVTEKSTKLYVAFRRIRNFATVVVQKSSIIVYLKMEPTAEALKEPNTRDVREIGHWGTGDLELSIKNAADFDRAKTLLQRASAAS